MEHPQAQPGGSPQPYQPQPPQAPQPLPYQQPQPAYQPQPRPPYQPPQQQPNPVAAYQQRLRTVAMLTILSLLAFYAINLFVAGVVGFAAMVASGSLGGIFSAGFAAGLDASGSGSPFPSQSFTQDMLPQDLPYGLASIAGIVMGACALFIVRGKRLVTEDLTKVAERIRLPELLGLFVLILGINAVFTLVPLVVTTFLPGLDFLFGGTENDLFLPYVNPPGILYIVLIGPIFEEIIFRGAILRSLQPFGRNFAIVISSLLFGLYHLFLFQGTFAFFVGILLAWCTLRFSIKWAMLLHVLNNAMSMLLAYLNIDPLIVIGIYLLFLVLGLIAALRMYPRFPQQLHEGKPADILLAPGAPGAPFGQPSSVAVAKAHPFAVTFTSAWFIVGISIAFVISALTMLLL
ncbi:MAG: CPBP family intramembrane metalloprotease [Coriobacteriales bacterium]|jgi:membrane protease YdiL (CAAX protease family)|nr:CPBP family intramembrane metalloprotease [Coriobacteriales bacterium]